MVLFVGKGKSIMTDKNAIRADWQIVGNDLRVALGLRRPDVMQPTKPLDAFLDGVRTLNVFGTKIRHR